MEPRAAIKNLGRATNRGGSGIKIFKNYFNTEPRFKTADRGLAKCSFGDTQQRLLLAARDNNYFLRSTSRVRGRTPFPWANPKFRTPIKYKVTVFCSYPQSKKPLTRSV